MHSPKNWDLEIDPRVYKVLKKMPRRDAEVVFDVIGLLPMHPYFGDIQKMKGEDNTWRRRVGSYRIFYKIKVIERMILVFHIERRTSSTY